MDDVWPNGRQIAAARALVGMSLKDLAAGADISLEALERIEANEFVTPEMAENMGVLRRVLENAGAVFLAENGHGPGVRLRKSAPAGAPLAISIEELNAENDE
jgi:transcriptional regulator with XRE-family HTH domain